jgi:hypothetical protein
MPHAEVSLPIKAPADQVWRAVGSFSGIDEWHPLLTRVDSEGEQPGAHRTAHMRSGNRQVECLLECRPEERRYRYEVNATPLPVKNYIAEIKVDDNGDGSSRVTWCADFDTPGSRLEHVTRTVEDFYRAGLRQLKERFEA